MASFIAWLDYSEHERRKALEVIDLFKETGTLDEMGVGTVRDVFADLLFPGTSTIQTRAKYFLFIPWTYRDLERRRVGPAEMAERARREEIRLIKTLAESADRAGVIGIESRERLQRLPSTIYWAGLQTLGLRLFQGSQDQYQRSLGRFYAEARRRAQLGESETGDVVEPLSNWHPGLPPAPEGFPAEATLALSEPEAEYLRDRILSRVPGTLFAQLVGRCAFWEPCGFPWEHPEYHGFPRHLREQLEHAHNFSLALHGAAILYNLLCARALDSGEGIAGLERRLAEWTVAMEARRDGLSRWSRNDFWSMVLKDNPRVPIPTRHFIDSWLDRVLSGALGEALGEDREVRRLIVQRERVLKGARARLTNRRALEVWAFVTNPLPFDYRWHRVQTIVGDILAGLGR